MKYLTGWFCCCVAVIASTQALAADLRIGVVNPLKVLEAAPQAASAKTKIETEFASRDRALVALQDAFKKKVDRLTNDAAVLSDTERQRLERELGTERRDLRRQQGEFQQDLNRRRNEEFGKIQKEVVEAIQALAREQKYDIIVGEGVIYATPGVDLTDEVIKRLKSRR